MAHRSLMIVLKLNEYVQGSNGVSREFVRIPTLFKVLPATEIMHIPVNRPTLKTTPRG